MTVPSMGKGKKHTANRWRDGVQKSSLVLSVRNNYRDVRFRVYYSINQLSVHSLQGPEC